MVDFVKWHKKVNIICEIHGIFEQSPVNHLCHKQGCKKCATEKRANSNTNSVELFIQKAIEVHGNKYDYSSINYINTLTKVNIICPIHGLFEQQPSNHISSKQGCPICGGSQKLSRTQFIQQATIIHNNTYDYSLVEYINAQHPVIIICPIHGQFIQSPSNHTNYNKNGCPACSHRGYSKMCIKWLNQLMYTENINIQHIDNGGEYKIPNTKLKADGYCVETNTIYEFYGDYWHGNPKIHLPDIINKVNYKSMGELYQKTIERENQIISMGYNLVVMWESDY